VLDGACEPIPYVIIADEFPINYLEHGGNLEAMRLDQRIWVDPFGSTLLFDTFSDWLQQTHYPSALP
jgi:hypothetical protein